MVSARTSRLGAAMENDRPRLIRAIVLMTLVTGLVGAMAFRLSHLQLVEGASQRQAAERNRLRGIPLVPDRGALFDRKGQVLARSKLIRSVYLSPQRHTAAEWQTILQPMEGIFDRPITTIAQEIATQRQNGRGDMPIRVARDLTPEGFVRLAELNPGNNNLSIRVEAERDYPQGTTAAHVIGYLGEAGPEDMKRHPDLPMGATIGKAGIERLADDRLRGRWGYDWIEADAKGRLLRPAGQQAPKPGDPVKLTLDLAVQQAAERGLQGRRGAVVALDPRTGAVLALASNPTFDPNWFTHRITKTQWAALQDKSRPLLNRALQGYPPASTFKIVTSVAAIQSGAFGANAMVGTSGALNLGGTVFREHGGSGYGTIGFARALEVSSNTFYYQVGMKTGPEAIAQWGTALGIGQPLKLGLLGSKGFLPIPATKQSIYRQPWYLGDTVSMAIGQGLVLSTPLELATMVATIANGGQRVTPHLLADQTNQPEFRPQSIGLKPEGLAVIREGLNSVVRQGTGKVLNDPSLPPSAGKTGTAEVPSGDNNAMYVGYAPIDRPEIAVAIAVENAGYGGAVAAPIAKEVLKAYFGGAKPPAPAAAPAPGLR
ncbi:MAG: penicillin-binding protein 2 [Oscillatoriales cyanobacterium]|nr:MAG: penicillin-binding protein 2 [Oscillatoriales cyanobacterium]